MTDIPDAAFAAAHDALLSDDLADVAEAAETTLRDQTPADGEPIEIETDPVLAEAPRLPRRGSFQDRIDQVTRARREAERERDYWREAAARAPQNDDPPPAEPADFRPHPADYPQGDADLDFLRDTARAEARQELAQVIHEQVKHHHAAMVEQAWQGRQSQFARATPDYHAVFDRDWACSEVMADAIRSSEDGPAAAYYLAQNPAEAARIHSLPPLAQVREMGRLEAAVGHRAGGMNSSHNPAVSNAPAPPPQARGAGARFRVSPDTDDFASFDRAY